MTRSAQQMLADAGFDTVFGGTLQVAKIHEDLAYWLTDRDGYCYVSLAAADGTTGTRQFTGPHRLRKARGHINRMKRGEAVLA